MLNLSSVTVSASSSNSKGNWQRHKLLPSRR